MPELGLIDREKMIATVKVVAIATSVENVVRCLGQSRLAEGRYICDVDRERLVDAEDPSLVFAG